MSYHPHVAAFQSGQQTAGQATGQPIVIGMTAPSQHIPTGGAGGMSLADMIRYGQARATVDQSGQMQFMPGACQSMTRAGAPCRVAPIPGTNKCQYHNGSRGGTGPWGTAGGAGQPQVGEQCLAETMAGTQCKYRVSNNLKYCELHTKKHGVHVREGMTFGGGPIQHGHAGGGPIQQPTFGQAFGHTAGAGAAVGYVPQYGAQPAYPVQHSPVQSDAPAMVVSMTGGMDPSSSAILSRVIGSLEGMRSLPATEYRRVALDAIDLLAYAFMQDSYKDFAEYMKKISTPAADTKVEIKTDVKTADSKAETTATASADTKVETKVDVKAADSKTDIAKQDSQPVEVKQEIVITPADAKPAEPKLERIDVYTDGACKGNPGPAGAGLVAYFPTGPAERSHFIGPMSTNNIAELVAFEMALIILDEYEAFRGPFTLPVAIHTDSKYVEGMMALNWKAKENVELVNKIKQRYLQRAARTDIRVVWCKAHSGITGNERADTLANMAISTQGKGAA